VEPRFTITNAITAGLTAIERARGFLEAAQLSSEWIERMSNRALMLEAHHTTHIEGTQLSIEQAERVWMGQDVAQVNADDMRELLNFRAAFDLISSYLASGEPITEGLIREIHRRLVDGVRGGQGGPGLYRMVRNYVVSSTTGTIIYTPPPPEDVPPMMHDLIAWLRADTGIHSVLVAGIAQFQLVHIHPFLDGNGRTSRLLSTLCLYRTGYDFKRLFTLSEYYDRDRTSFYQAIQVVREQGMNMTGWLEFFVHGLATQLAEVRSRSENAIRSDLLAREHGLNERQIIALDHLMNTDRLTLGDIERLLPSVHRRTLQRDLRGLTDKGLIREVGSGPTDPNRYYVLEL
jgi:Fic family protein